MSYDGTMALQSSTTELGNRETIHHRRPIHDWRYSFPAQPRIKGTRNRNTVVLRLGHALRNVQFSNEP